MNNIPPGYWHLGNAYTKEYAYYLAEKHMETAKDGGYMIVKTETDNKIKWAVFAKESKK
jgi:hypothetical protein